MKLVGKFLALLLVALWLPVTSHCLMEDAGLIHRDACCAPAADSQRPGHDADEGACQVESAGFRLESRTTILAAVLLIAVACLVSLFSASIPQVPHLSQVRSAPPPEWVQSWQFFTRAVACGRAPSFLP
ncbi:MAG TPA: hypothetical protein VK968_06695 [Roseimicrobium sp.]|nr:hypothetical protein [Roseimicrobium sp.]